MCTIYALSGPIEVNKTIQENPFDVAMLVLGIPERISGFCIPSG